MTTLPPLYIKKINENINKSKEIIPFFGKKWLNDEIYTERDYHPLITILSDPDLLNRLIKNLSVLKFKCPKFPRIIRKLKTDKANFFSNLSEVEVVSYYYQNHDPGDLEYEPSVEGGKNLDLMLNAKNNVKYYFEIFTVLEDEIQQRSRDIMDEISLEIRKLNLPYVINFKINEDFKISYESDFIDFIKTSLNENKGENSFKFYKEGLEVAEFRCIESKSIRGAANSFGPSKFINPVGRVRDRILSKLNEQIPSNQNNILVINLSYVLPLFFVIEEALKLITYPENLLMVIGYVENDYKNKKKGYMNPDFDKNALNDIIRDIK